MKSIDIINKKFNKLTVIEYDHPKLEINKRTKYYYKCKCDCGNICLVEKSLLMKNETKSCGCLNNRICSDRPGFTGYKNINGKFWGTIKKNASKRNLSFNITIEQAWQKFEEQNNKCALSGVPITLIYKKTHKERTASLDRIDNSKGYEIDNIQWVHKNINKMRLDLSIDRFIELCKLINNKMGV